MTGCCAWSKDRTFYGDLTIVLPTELHHRLGFPKEFVSYGLNDMATRYLTGFCILVFSLSTAPVMAAKSGSVNVCFNYGCKSRQKVPLKGKGWKQVARVFAKPARTAEKERQAIRKAVGLMEQFVGKRTVTSADKARNSNTGVRGSMDCIDESTNTTTYLRLFEKRGWLKWHKVKPRKKRSPFIFDEHWTAVIETKKGGEQYAVDSWFFDNGKPAYVVPLKDWLKKVDPS